MGKKRDWYLHFNVSKWSACMEMMIYQNSYQIHSLLVQMTRLNEGLSLFDAILIVPMFQIVWTFFSICTGFVYFQEYQVLFHFSLSNLVVALIVFSVVGPTNLSHVEKLRSNVSS